MYPGLQAKIRPQQPAFIMAQSGETVTYAELERRSNRLAHFLRAAGLGRLDHYAIFMENNAPRRAPHPSSVSKRGGCCILLVILGCIRSDTRGGRRPKSGTLASRWR
jgi:long-chain acyl-CoA synthetase